MQFRRKIVAIAVGLTLATAGAIGVAAADLKGFDFKYEQEGDRGVQPVQVFDDGHRTYFQFPSTTTLPTISTTTSSGRKTLIPEFKQPYVVVDGVYPAFVLTSKEGTRAVVSYSGGARPLADGRGRQGQISQPQAVQPQDTLYARALPVPAARSAEEVDPLIAKFKAILGETKEEPRTPVQSAQARADRIPTATFYGEAGTTPLAVPVARPGQPSQAVAGRFDPEVYASARLGTPAGAQAVAVKAAAAHEGAEAMVVTFSKGSSEVQGSYARQLAELANKVTSNQRVKVLGLGVRGAKAKLANDRANAVKTLLITFGVPGAQIDLRTGVGNDDLGSAELTIVDSAPPVATVAPLDTRTTTVQGLNSKPKYIVDVRPRQDRDVTPAQGLRQEMSAPGPSGFNRSNMLRADYRDSSATAKKVALSPEDSAELREELRSIAKLYESKLITREQTEAMLRKLGDQGRPTAQMVAPVPQTPRQALAGLPPVGSPQAVGQQLFGAAEATQINWEIRMEDKTLRRAMERWGKANGYQLSWEAPIDFPVKLEATFVGKFEDAIKAVMQSLRDTQTPMEAFIYDNKVIRVVPQGTRTPN